MIISPQSLASRSLAFALSLSLLSASVPASAQPLRQESVAALATQNAIGSGAILQPDLGAQFPIFLSAGRPRLIRLIALAGLAVALAPSETPTLQTAGSFDFPTLARTLLGFIALYTGTEWRVFAPKPAGRTPIHRYEDYADLKKRWANEALTGGPSEKIILEVKTEEGSVLKETIRLPQSVLRDEENLVAQYVAHRLQFIGPILGLKEVSIRLNGFSFNPFRQKEREARQAMAERLVENVRTKATLWLAFKLLSNYGPSPVWTTRRLEADPRRDVARSARVNYEKGVAFGVDVGGSSVKGVLVQDGLVTQVVHDEYGDRGVGTTIEAVLDKLSRNSGVSLQNRTIYAGVPSLVNNGEVLKMTNLDASKPGSTQSLVELQDRLRQQQISLQFGNDANMAGFFQSAAMALSDGIVIVNSLGTGTGLAILKNGRLLKAPMELHVPMDYSAHERCGCGLIGCAESLTNVAFVVRLMTSRLNLNVGESAEFWSQLTDHAKMGHIRKWLFEDAPIQGQYVRKAWEETFRDVGANLARAYMVMAEMLGTKQITVVWTGGLAEQRVLIEEGLTRELKARHSKLVVLTRVSVGQEAEHYIGGPIHEASTYYQGAVGAALQALQVDAPKEGPGPRFWSGWKFPSFGSNAKPRVPSTAA